MLAKISSHSAQDRGKIVDAQENVTSALSHIGNIMKTFSLVGELQSDGCRGVLLLISFKLQTMTSDVTNLFTTSRFPRGNVKQFRNSMKLETKACSMEMCLHIQHHLTGNRAPLAGTLGLEDQISDSIVKSTSGI